MDLSKSLPDFAADPTPDKLQLSLYDYLGISPCQIKCDQFVEVTFQIFAKLILTGIIKVVVVKSSVNCLPSGSAYCKLFLASR